jgi:hypothetical protein
MGQHDVFVWLRGCRECGDESFFYPKEIEKGLRSAGLSNGSLEHIRGDCFSLWQSGNGCLEMYDFDLKGMTNWMKAFRVKKIYCRKRINCRKCNKLIPFDAGYNYVCICGEVQNVCKD